MISQLLNACESIAGFAIRRGNGPGTRISRIGMPNGFFLNDLLWFGDGATKRTAVSRGFMIEPGEMTAFSVRQLNDLHERLRVLLGMLGQEYQLQVQWSIDSDLTVRLGNARRSLTEFEQEAGRCIPSLNQQLEKLKNEYTRQVAQLAKRLMDPAMRSIGGESDIT